MSFFLLFLLLNFHLNIKIEIKFYIHTNTNITISVLNLEQMNSRRICIDDLELCSLSPPLDEKGTRYHKGRADINHKIWEENITTCQKAEDIVKHQGEERSGGGKSELMDCPVSGFEVLLDRGCSVDPEVHQTSFIQDKENRHALSYIDSTGSLETTKEPDGSKFNTENIIISKPPCYDDFYSVQYMNGNEEIKLNYKELETAVVNDVMASTDPQICKQPPANSTNGRFSVQKVSENNTTKGKEEKMVS